MLSSTGILIRRPFAPSAVAVLPTDGSVDDARLSDALSANGVAVICMPLSMDFAEGVRVARDEFGDLLPLMVAAAGASVPAASHAARRAGLSAAVLLNTPVGHGVRQRGLSTMMFVDSGLLASRLWGRLASRLGHSSFHVTDGSLDSPLSAWLADPSTIVRDPLTVGSTVAALVASVALVAVPLVPSAVSASANTAARTHSTADPFAGGVSVGATQIRGDYAGAQAPRSAAGKDGDGNKVPSTSIQGDGAFSAAATGSIQLIDANGMKYFVNTNITFSTTSSASGAMSEASFTAAVPASTSAGGTAASTLSDAFDGYNSLFVDVAGVDPTVLSPSNVYNKNGAATLDSACGDRQVIFPVKTMQGLDVQRMVYVPADDGFARWFNSFTNSSGAPVTVGVGTFNNLGSDSNTRVTGSSSGDNVSDLSDTWVGTFQNFSGTTSSDPRLGHVIQGAGAPVAPTAVNFVDGDDNPLTAWDITVQPGETVTLMNFVAPSYTKALAAAKATELAALTPGVGGVVNGLRCLTEAQIHSLANFAMPDISVAPVSVNEAAGTATLTFTRSTSGAAATATFSLAAGTATAGADYTDPASFTVSFADGATTAQVTIPIVNDTLIEGDETILATITGVTGYGRISASAATAAVTIVSDDVAPTTTTAPATTVPVTTLPIPVPEPALPATGQSTGSLGWLAALFAGAGAAMVGVTRRRRSNP